MTILEAAAYIGVSRGVIESWLSKGILPYEELPSLGTGAHRFRRIRLSDINKFLNQNYHCKQQNYKENKKDIILLPK